MGDGVSRRNSKTSIACIFCGRSGVAKAHFWPGWAMRAAKIRAGETEKTHLACKKCQSDWIGAVEAKAEDAVAGLIEGKAVTLSADAQTALAQWITLRVMATEQDRLGDALIPQHDRSALRASGTIPSYATIWITRSASQKWRNAYAAPAASLSLATEPAPVNPAINAKTVALGIGELFAYTLICRADGVNLNDYIMFEAPVMQLWPSSGSDIVWPETAAIQDRDADAISLSLETLLRHPNAKLRAQAARAA